ncbi:hypothetical protein K402DRAFT_116442 [Aulographum hederae CBS 113979]|uniref:CENP-V/GFA domain-containing protein n=1 Tax=Aulographum hederae CBS 113979 TaxID=1176131 RepID=A0A6G1GW64_9PEZI|nr:hypothetical protein K402DRAFT_116442 [Aulographum hederae CBS 113979]
MSKEEETVEIKASCLCKASRFQWKVPKSYLPFKGRLCHCDSCQKSHGALATFHLRIRFAATLAILEPLVRHKGSCIESFFCRTCGSVMGHTDDDVGTRSPAVPSSAHWTMSTGVIEEPEALIDFYSHIYVLPTKDGGASDWLKTIKGKKLLMNILSEGQGEFPDGWQKMMKRRPCDTSTPTIRARCCCGGVDMTIKRPASSKSSNEEGPPWWRAKSSPDKWLAVNCACSNCRISSGCDIMAWAYVSSDCITFSLEADKSTITIYESSLGAKRGFCGKCGATAWMTGGTGPENVTAVSVGLLEDCSGSRAENWLEWETNIFFAEDAAHKTLMDALSRGLREWADEKKNDSKVREQMEEGKDEQAADDDLTKNMEKKELQKTHCAEVEASNSPGNEEDVVKAKKENTVEKELAENMASVRIKEEDT